LGPALPAPARTVHSTRPPRASQPLPTRSNVQVSRVRSVVRLSGCVSWLSLRPANSRPCHRLGWVPGTFAPISRAFIAMGNREGARRYPSRALVFEGCLNDGGPAPNLVTTRKPPMSGVCHRSGAAGLSPPGCRRMKAGRQTDGQKGGCRRCGVGIPPAGTQRESVHSSEKKMGKIC
jgi:hypothetical protein